ncbi:baeRF7 domain-containing protein [Belliella aquatica]|uniref:Uncharacterized protein n=1 Tax=Belliella aquatica TaxID=1323734 RepID=A0ABQ1M7X4_9BACT|nr:hypothetical protein [Belliella aquatica]MCH7405615.1 hypothetical protein [Belliella aquatica]GGC36401.1 hypothetical protein GCM10010993_14070 [Belliella aquatica]
MEIFNRNAFINLSKKKGNPFVSIYSPTSRQSSEGYKKDQIHFKNQLQEVTIKLEKDHNIENKEIKNLLSPAFELLDDQTFWQNNSDMLACFISSEGMEVIKVPIDLENGQNFIGEKPLLLPMIPELSDDGHYYILLLNLDKNLLYEATRNTVQEIILDREEVAVSFTTEEKEDENQKQLQGQGGSGNAGAMYHGHDGGSDEVKKVTILNYFHRMTNMLEPKLNNNPLPLVLAGVDYLIPIFKEATKYNHLLDGHVSGAYGEKDMMTLHQKSWEVVAPFFEKERIKRKEAFNQKAADGLAISNDNLKIIKAALTGGIDTLLVNMNHKHLFGTYDPETHQINVSEKQENTGHCLIDEAAARTVEYKGKVYMVEEENMPEEAQVAAILRYPL